MILCPCRRRFLLHALFFGLVIPAMVYPAPIRLAFLTIDNQSANPRYDYLEGIIRGVLLYDLSSQPEVEVVNRSDLDSVLREQELQLSSLADDPQNAARVGRIVRADYLVKGEYVFLGSDVQVTVRLLEAASARTLTFSERGSSENMLHFLSEQILRRLTGRQVSLQSEQKERSIISLQDEKPGKISLHSILVDAEIFMDEEFVGYSTGDGRVPFVIDNVAPGLHRLRLHLQGFGVIKEPEITFHDWEETVEVKPGKNQVVRTTARHFNDLLYPLQKLLWEEIDLSLLQREGQARRRHDISFTDRQGKKVPVLFGIDARLMNKTVEVRAVLAYEGKEFPLEMVVPVGERKELRQTVDKVEVAMEADAGDISYQVWRTDIQQNMFR